jgi:hypothetical protein
MPIDPHQYDDHRRPPKGLMVLAAIDTLSIADLQKITTAPLAAALVLKVIRADGTIAAA